MELEVIIGSTGVIEANKWDIEIYPNPSSNNIIVNTNDLFVERGYIIRIVNQVGLLVFETIVNESQYEISRSQISEVGLYYLQLMTLDGTLRDIRKIVIQ